MDGALAVYRPQLFGSIEYFARISAVAVWVHLDDSVPTKKGWKPIVSLRAPVGSGLMKIPVKESVEGFNEKTLKWNDRSAAKMWSFVKACYQEAPFFRELAWLEDVFRERHDKFVDVAVDTSRRLLDYLGFRTRVVLASGLPDLSCDPSVRIARYCRQLGCRTYVAGSQGLWLLKPEPFKDVGIEVRFFLWKCPGYAQLWKKPFDPDLSILDLIANVGPQAGEILESAIRISESEWGDVGREEVDVGEERRSESL